MKNGGNMPRAPIQAQYTVPRKSLIKRIIASWEFYVLALPGVIMLIMFRYLPMYGVVIAFKDFQVGLGIFDSPWIGLDHFMRLLRNPMFTRAFRNTLILSVYKIVFGMPIPIVMALLLNEMRNMPFKRTIQTVVYIPHFISWVIISGIFMDILSPSNGIINRVITAFGGKEIFFLTENNWIRSIAVVTEVWKESGWSAIIYLAAITGVDQELYQAASIDGAGRWRQTLHVTLPAIRGTFIVLLIMRLGSIMGANFEQIYMLYNPTVYANIDVIDTYVFRTAFQTLDFGFTTAAGLFTNVIGCMLLIVSNTIVKRLGGRGMY